MLLTSHVELICQKLNKDLDIKYLVNAILIAMVMVWCKELFYLFTAGLTFFKKDSYVKYLP
jgi:hypothetical protein